jgi:hypothetical protein
MTLKLTRLSETAGPLSSIRNDKEGLRGAGQERIGSLMGFFSGQPI